VKRELVIAIFFVIASPTLGETAPTPTTTPPTASPEIWSSPEPGRSRETTPPPASALAPSPAIAPPDLGSRRYEISEPDSGESLREVGLTLGTPSVLNLNLGYWGDKGFPIVVRASGAYFGDTRGVEVDVGYVFMREAHFRQYVAVSGVAWKTTTNWSSPWNYGSSNNSTDNFWGVGPSYGLNWHGLSVQAGIAMGPDNSTTNYAGGTSYYNGTPTYNPGGTSTINQFEPQVIFQVGYTFLW
jgi:hypothetical protein